MDGSCGPRVVSLRKYGNQNRYETVRKDACQTMRNELKEKFKNDLEGGDYKKKLESIQGMEKDGVWFSDTEMQVCSNIYGFPIIIFSVLNKMMYFDTLIAPEG